MQSDGVQTYVMEPSLQETHELIQEVLGKVEQVVMGKRPILDLCAVGILAGGNTLFEDNPGLQKLAIKYLHKLLELTSSAFNLLLIYFLQILLESIFGTKKIKNSNFVKGLSSVIYS